MTGDDGHGRFSASIPAQPAGTLVRYRIKAIDQAGAAAPLPAENDLRPALSAYVHDKWEPAKIPFGQIIHVHMPGARRGGGGGAFRGFFGGNRGGNEGGDVAPRRAARRLSRIRRAAVRRLSMSIPRPARPACLISSTSFRATMIAALKFTFTRIARSMASPS